MGKVDRSWLAVRRQLNAMRCATYDIGIKRRTDGKMLSRVFTVKDALKSVDWLKLENTKGSDIYIRPAGDENQGIILADDLTKTSLAQLKAAGYEPAAVIETSPNNYQAWIRVSENSLRPQVATMISKYIARKFNADPNSADWRHYGRLAGFTNRKPQYSRGGLFPWILCQEASGKTASQGAEITRQANIQADRQQAATATRQEIQYQKSVTGKKRDPATEYQNHLETLQKRYTEFDASRADFMICRSMAAKGYSREEIALALSQSSPDLTLRKTGHENDYIERTVSAAFNAVFS